MVFRSEIKSIIKTTDRFPAQWEGILSNGDEVYIRYRWGTIQIYLNGNKYPDFEIEVSEEHDDGTLPYRELRKYCSNIPIRFPEQEDENSVGISLKIGLSQALRGDIHPIEDLWEGIDDETK